MPDVKTVFGSLADYQKGGIQVINDDPRNYVFSNVFEVASKARPYERIAVGKNFEYVIECLRAEGTSPWFTCDHDEFALVMDGTVEVRLQKPGAGQAAPAGSDGAIQMKDAPGGPRMGRMVCRRGHMALLPKGAAYQFHADAPGVITIQTVHGPLTIERWAEICETRSI
ncbi:hydroxyquinol 1,2-dioxygenase [Vineibacter terrae]|uniref:Hydroxyquinol 1,2-dioxygenase n=1 Tax=Vineibacter terrae TaxID=2586908 RepID=A0A5C8PVF6_9HYPH|nr:hydroxyquinol 1,2-dioxygenase [Vineibacter terrae]TXL82041.1 hydroxyquinol 1,2-dioxygenase [Vineibacter terrae]